LPEHEQAAVQWAADYIKTNADGPILSEQAVEKPLLSNLSIEYITMVKYGNFQMEKRPFVGSCLKRTELQSEKWEG
jgi:hypothetical protein